MKSVIVNENDAGQRLDKFLGKYFKTMPKSLIYKGIRKKRIKINGKKGDINTILNVWNWLFLTLFLNKLKSYYYETLLIFPYLYDKYAGSQCSTRAPHSYQSERMRPIFSEKAFAGRL